MQLAVDFRGGTGRGPAAAAPSAQVVPFAWRRRRDPEAARIIRLVAESRDVPALMLLHPSRCDAPIAEARQLAMYLIHVLMSRTYQEVGHYFRRDRTTVAHACAQVEDMRDDPRFEAEVSRIELAVAGKRRRIRVRA
jgi:hypothetical protein